METAPGRPRVGTTRAPSGALLGVGAGVALAEPLLEAGDAAAGVEDALLARVEREAGRACLDGQLTARRRAAGGEGVPAPTGHGGCLVLGVDSGLHRLCLRSLRVCAPGSTRASTRGFPGSGGGPTVEYPRRSRRAGGRVDVDQVRRIHGADATPSS